MLTPQPSDQLPSDRLPTNQLPTVSILTPTYNRRHFLPQLIKLVAAQKYPKELIEWFILDDSQNDNSDLFADVSYATYIHLKNKLLLAEKRNCLNEMASNKILVNMDDDDYYPPTRIVHAVEAIMDSGVHIAGCTAIHMYMIRDKKIYQFGPVNNHHGTAATLAYTKTYANTHSYGTSKALNYAEEDHFTNGWVEPMAQMNPTKTIMALSHSTNTVDKTLLVNEDHGSIGPMVHETCVTIDTLVTPDMVDFYKNLEYVDIPNEYTEEIICKMEEQAQQAEIFARNKIANLVKMQKIRYALMEHIKTIIQTT